MSNLTQFYDYYSYQSRDLTIWMCRRRKVRIFSEQQVKVEINIRHSHKTILLTFN